MEWLHALDVAMEWLHALDAALMEGVHSDLIADSEPSPRLTMPTE
jgi:hypothetical protein